MQRRNSNKIKSIFHYFKRLCLCELLFTNTRRDKVIEIQKGEMKRQMEELMKERELVKKHEEEMRKAMLEEQHLVQHIFHFNWNRY